MEHAEKTNLILEQYGVLKRTELEASPFKFFRDADRSIAINRHQVVAFCRAIDAMPTGGMILADEVGLGKTIEAGFVLKYMIANGWSRILIITPASLRMQWKSELQEKFGIDARIADRNTFHGSYSERTLFRNWLIKSKESCVVIASYGFASKVIEIYKEVEWDFCIIDEAHNLRNVYNKAKIAKSLLDLLNGIPKLLLTATPIQNSIEDLFGLVSFIDEDIFWDINTFRYRFGSENKMDELRKAIAPVVQRTLRKDVPDEEIHFTNRIPMTFDFTLSTEEEKLYREVDAFLKRSWLYSIPKKNRGLINLVIRKILASSSFAIEETFKILRDRLKYAYQEAKDKIAEDNGDPLDFLLAMFDEEDEAGDFQTDEKEPEENEKQKEIKNEEAAIDSILITAGQIHSNSKIEALKMALESAFSFQQERGIPEKAVVFTESRRTQEYIVSELLAGPYEKFDVLVFNGSFSGAEYDEMYLAWKAKHPESSQDKSVEYRQAVIDTFRNSGKILVSTDAGAEGLNLQFCNVVINYDLPWNPQRIEQRIGRCHRYGQKNDVVAINLLNMGNEADKRVYDILSIKLKLFDGLLGSSDSALGLLDSGIHFERDVLQIYQQCNTVKEIDSEFDKLEKRIDKILKKNSKGLKSVLLPENDDKNERILADTKTKVLQYFEDCRFWDNVPSPDMDGDTFYWRNTDWGETVVESHGLLFVGAFCNGNKMLFPVLDLLDDHCQESGFSEREIIDMLQYFDDDKTYEQAIVPDDYILLGEITDRITERMTQRYWDSVKPLIQERHKRLLNLQANRKTKMKMNISELAKDIEECDRILGQELSVADIMKYKGKRMELKRRFDSKLASFSKHVEYSEEECKKKEEEYRKSLEISPILIPKIILRF